MKTPPGANNGNYEEVRATLGHEIRNPLSALSHALEIWPDVQQDQFQLEELRSLIQRQVRQLIRISDDLLDGARRHQGRLKLRRESISIRELIDGDCEEVRPFVDRCGHMLTVTQPLEPIMVDGDPSRFLQVFANLIQNAAKFTDRNGSLRIAVESRDGWAVVRVTDNGTGIVTNMLPHIINGFRQVDGMRKPEGDGFGIGLALVNAILDLHGGTVTAHSAGPGQGSEFTRLLSLLSDMDCEHRPARQTVAACEGNGQGGRLPAWQILVADDDRSNRELPTRLLRKIGQSVTVASNGEMAVRMVLNERPQVVFLDLMMPGMDSFEVARRLRSLPELSDLVLIALSGSTDEESRRCAVQAGFDKYLVKPTGLSVLAEALADIPSPKKTVRPYLRRQRE